MRIKTLTILLLCCLSFACKKDNKTTENTEVEKTAIDPITEEIDLELEPDAIMYSGVWMLRSRTIDARVILNQDNNVVKGSISYSTLNENGEIKTKTGPVKIEGTVENEVLKVNLLNDKDEKVSSATLTQDNTTITFQLTGKKGNFPDNFTATRKSS